MRVWVEKVHGIPPEQVIGSSIVTKFEMVDPRLAKAEDVKLRG